MRKLAPAALFAAATIAYWAALWWLFVASTAACRITGACDETGHVYGSLSGFGGTLLFSAAMLAPPWYLRHTCHHAWWCVRWGAHEAAGGVFKLCRVHHPDLQGQPVTAELIEHLHAEYKAGRSLLARPQKTLVKPK